MTTSTAQEGSRNTGQTRNVEMDRLREQRLCLHCREKWQYGHKCKNKGQVATAEGIESNENIPEIVIDELPAEDTITKEAEISLNAVVGGEGLNTIKLPRVLHNKDIIVLVDSGSTHSFLDPALALNLNLPLEEALALTVTIANGDKMACNKICRQLIWLMQGEELQKDFRMLRLGGCDMVLGMDWIDSYAPIELHTRPPSISFHKEGKRVNL